MKQVIDQVTQRIRARSTGLRADYLARVDALASRLLDEYTAREKRRADAEKN